LKIKEKQIYVHILCANTQYKRVGTEIINIIKDIATKLDYNEIQLQSVTDAIEFYIKLNFKCYKDSCMLERAKNGDIVVVDTETVKEYIHKGYECIDNHILMVYKIRDMKGGKRKTSVKTLKRRS
jgi:pimeloyl-CoA synthetase